MNSKTAPKLAELVPAAGPTSGDAAEGRAQSESEGLYHDLVSTLGVGVVSLDPAGRLLFINAAAQRILGLAPEQAILGTRLPELRVLRPDGTPIPEDEHPVWRALGTGVRSADVEMGLDRPDGTRCWLRATFAPVRREGTALPHALLASLIDITEHKLLDDRYLQAQRMDALGRLAGGVAHDFNNILTTILGYSELLLSRVEPSSAIAEEVSEIHKAGERAAVLTQQLLAFSRRQPVDVCAVDLNELLTSLDGTLRRLAGEHIEVRVVGAPSLWRVRADPGQLEQVIVNLVVNACDAMPDGGRLIVETSKVELDRTYCEQRVGVQPGPFVQLAVSDSGIGMEPGVAARAFEPFFTTKGPGKGSGLGLASVYGIVKQAGGHVGAYSEVGHGSVFRISLPRAGAVDRQSSAGLRKLCRGKEAVLVVEDEPAVRALARRVLEEGGFTVLEAAGAPEAIAVAESADSSIHLLLTDVVLPTTSGPKLAQELRERRPEMKVLLMSGYTDAAIAWSGVLEEGWGFLAKPFTAAALTQKVRSVLDL